MILNRTHCRLLSLTLLLQVSLSIPFAKPGTQLRPSSQPKPSEQPFTEILYKQDTAALAGIYYPPAKKSKVQPGIVLFPDWMGVSEIAKQQGQKLASLGYAVFIADIYGKDIRPKTPQEARQQAAFYKSHRDIMRLRAQVAYATLLKQGGIDSQRVATIGYCFGGTCALELARMGTLLVGAISVHGGLDTPSPADSTTLSAKILVLHGADDPYVPAEQVQNFILEMKQAKADWQMNFYGNAVHAFTNPSAGKDPKMGAAYNAKADYRSFEAVQNFYKEIFSKGF